jgi:acryloyl-coenzyme A reductase
MKAMVLERFGEPMVLREVPEPAIGPQDILVRVRASGLCATDLKVADGLVKSVKLPLIAGHESAGEVVKIGANVDGWQIGDHGVIYINLACGSCYNCRKGRENFCTSPVRRLGFEEPGGFGEYCRVPARNLCKVAKSVPLEQASILSGSIATPLHGIRTQGRLQAGETAAIVGVGGLGIHAVQLAAVMGARVIAVDIAEEKLAAARKYGAEETINSKNCDFAAEIRRLTGGEGADLVVEIVAGSAVPPVLEKCVEALRMTGRLLILGYHYGQHFRLDPAKMVYDGLEVMGSRSASLRDLMDVISLVERGKVKPVIDECFPLEKTNEAFTRLRNSAALGRIVLTL